MLGANRVLAANKVGSIKGGNKLIEKLIDLKTRKLFKLKKLRNRKSTKFYKSSKSRNSPKFNAQKNRPSFLILKARAAFNYLWLAFTKILIFLYFDLECYI